ncbi:MATE efflux family protein [Klebsormidium nitens]|uniref:Protein DETOXIFICATION n=1 Tax=Klebsormidium nitens TaxID=105231 RepID=A0A1Y1HW02_KLENI|nr:MATE efflux family protein [Klebsormidium nitens]|eukprot:GAQ80018.1 MATE efflux family protein [Klebsormidium nitens]
MGDILDPDFNEVAFGDDSKHTWHATPVLDPGLSHYHFGPFPEIEAPLLQGEVQDVHFPNLEERPDLPQEGAGDPMSRRDERGVQFDMVDSIIRITLYKALVPIVQLAFVGRLGVTALAGASVAMSVANLTGFLTMAGFAGTMERMAIQSFGHGGGKLVALGTVAQKTCFLSLLACIPVGFLWLHAERPLSFLVRDPGVAEGAAVYLKWLVLALVASAGLYPATQYLRIQNVNFPLGMASFLTLLFYVPANCVLVHYFDLGLQGAAAALSSARAAPANVVGVVPRGPPRLAPVLGMTVWNTVPVGLDWFAHELLLLLPCALPDLAHQVAASAVWFQTVKLCVVLPRILSTSLTVRLTNELAAQKPGRARLACNTAVASTFLYGLILLILLLSIHGHWGKLFIPYQTDGPGHDSDAMGAKSYGSGRGSDAIGRLLDEVAPYAAVLQFFESLQIVLQGFLKGTGQELAGRTIDLLSKYAAGVPIMLVLTYFGFGLKGIWLGTILGQAGQVAFLYFVMLMTDWSYEVEKTAEIIQKS